MCLPAWLVCPLSRACSQLALRARQGDPLSSLLFCLYIKSAIDALTADPLFGDRITVYAYIDDVHIVGSVEDVLAARTALVGHLQQIELYVNPAKCSLLYFHDDTHPLTRAQLQAVRDVGLQRRTLTALATLKCWVPSSASTRRR